MTYRYVIVSGRFSYVISELLSTSATAARTEARSTEPWNWKPSAAVSREQRVQFLLLISGQQFLELADKPIPLRGQFRFGSMECDRCISDVRRSRRSGVQQCVQRLPPLPDFGNDGLGSGLFGLSEALDCSHLRVRQSQRILKTREP